MNYGLRIMDGGICSPSLKSGRLSSIRHSLRAFTLIELLLVMSIMGLLGTISIGGYRAMRRGMEERSVWQNVEAIMENARLRATIDRQPTIVYFWNETRREDSDAETLLVVGRAVAVRRAGRISAKDGNYLVDEFGDFSHSKGTDENGEDDDSQAEEEDAIKMRLYKMNGDESGGRDDNSSIVSQVLAHKDQSVTLMMLMDSDDDDDKVVSKEILAYGYYTKDAGKWSPGDAYGLEFAEITLPDNYIFGSNYSKDTDDPIADGPSAIRFEPGDSLKMPPLSAIRMGDDGKPTAQQVDNVK